MGSRIKTMVKIIYSSQSQENINISACVNGIPYINGAQEMGVYERIASVT